MSLPVTADLGNFRDPLFSVWEADAQMKRLRDFHLNFPLSHDFQTQKMTRCIAFVGIAFQNI